MTRYKSSMNASTYQSLPKTKLEVLSLKYNMVTEKIITGEKLPLVKKFEELVLSELPIHRWCAERDRLLKGKKF